MKRKKSWKFTRTDNDSMNSQNQRTEEDEFFKNNIRVAKQINREKVLQELETNEKLQKQAEDRNEIREPTEEELSLKDFTFPESLAFPVNNKFRLWLSTIPVPEFPADFARRCMKISVELPTSIRPGTMKALSTMSQEELEKMS